tara:strand:- start:84 stop:773 length:690 start_codon:yes stop_codon:yes gene_type:complete
LRITERGLAEVLQQRLELDGVPAAQVEDYIGEGEKTLVHEFAVGGVDDGRGENPAPILVSGHSVRTPGCSSSSGHSAFSFARLARKSSPTEVDSRRARSLDASTVARCMDMSSSGVASSEEESDAVLDDDARVVTLEHAATEPGPKPASPPPGVDENWGGVETSEGADVGGQGCAPETCRGVDLAVTTRIFGGPGCAPSMLARCSSNMCAAADVLPGFNQAVRGSWMSR